MSQRDGGFCRTVPGWVWGRGELSVCVSPVVCSHPRLVWCRFPGTALAVCLSPVDCPAHPLGQAVPLGVVGQGEMEALPESQMNNSFGVPESPRSPRADIKSIRLALPCPSALFYSFLVWSRGNASSCWGGGGREGGSRDHREVGETLDERAGWILLFLLKEDC